jgi:hypothetical protein
MAVKNNESKDVENLANFENTACLSKDAAILGTHFALEKLHGCSYFRRKPQKR